MTRIEKDKTQIIAEISNVRGATDEVARSKVYCLINKKV